MSISSRSNLGDFFCSHGSRLELSGSGKRKLPTMDSIQKIQCKSSQTTPVCFENLIGQTQRLRECGLHRGKAVLTNQLGYWNMNGSRSKRGPDIRVYVIIIMSYFFMYVFICGAHLNRHKKLELAMNHSPKGWADAGVGAGMWWEVFLRLKIRNQSYSKCIQFVNYKIFILCFW